MDTSVVDAIRADVLAAVHPPNTRLVELDLAERYGVPRAAVRSALIVLTAEGLVERQPNRGATVRALAIDEGIEIAELRRELEALCASHAAQASSPAERGELLGLVEAMRIATDEGQLGDYRELSGRFHERVAQLSGQETARRLLTEVRNHRLDVHFPEAYASPTTGDSLAQHAEIARAIAAADPEAAHAAMRAHITRVVDLLSEYAATVDEPARSA